MNGSKWRCPYCDHGYMEEILYDVTVQTLINGISENGDIVYGDQTNTDGTLDRYVCSGCGSAVTDENGGIIEEQEDLVDFLLGNWGTP